MKIVPIVLGSNQCNFTVLSPNSSSWEPSISQLIGKSSHHHHLNSAFDAFFDFLSWYKHILKSVLGFIVGFKSPCENLHL
jgi:hypothetical protein